MNFQTLLCRISEEISKNPRDVRAYEDYFGVLRLFEGEDFKAAHDMNKKLRYATGKAVRSTESDLSVLGDFHALLKRELLFDALVDFDAYMQYIEFDREPEKKFYLPRRRILRPIVQDLQDLLDDKLDLLSISMPPGTGKSTLGIFFLSRVMGEFPDQPNLASAHSGLLTRSFYDGVYSTITDPEYLWSDIFPGVQLAATNSKEESIDLNKKHRFSTLTCRAINASLTGATRCEKILYADDLCSGIEEALSKERMDNLWSKYTNDLKSRKKLGAKELHIATRWTIHDVIGRLECMYRNDPRAKFVVVPALNEQGESNFNYNFGVGFDTTYFDDMRNNLDDASFRALYMNEPIEREGLLYNSDELQRYFELPDRDPDAIIAVCDTKDRGSDYCVLPIAYQYGQRFFIEDFICDNSNPDVVEARLVEKLLKHHVHSARFESNSAGGRVAQKVQEEVSKKGGITKITTKFTTANKETRIIVSSGYAKEHFLFKDESYCKDHKEYKKAMDMLCGYTVAGRNKNDDVPDAIAMLVSYIDSLQASSVEVFKRPW